MTSKNPFEYEGLSLSLQGGIMHFNNNYEKDISLMNDFSFRYAKKLSEKAAFKITGGYLKADDWNATDYRNKRNLDNPYSCLLYTSPSPRDAHESRMPSSA